jgi:DNA-binding transcriptional LysR family regulator
VIDSAASSLGLTLNHVVTVSQFATMLGFVRADIGLAIAPHSGVASFLGKELSAVPIKERPLARELGLITLNATPRQPRRA